MSIKKTSKILGYTLLELALGIGIVATLALGVFGAYKKLSTSAKVEASYQQVVSVISGIERTQANNGGTYIAKDSATTITEAEFPELARTLGGDSQIKDIADWTYQCEEGSDKTITIVTKNFMSDVIAKLIEYKINANFAPWHATTIDKHLEISLPNAVCR